MQIRFLIIILLNIFLFSSPAVAEEKLDQIEAAKKQLNELVESGDWDEAHKLAHEITELNKQAHGEQSREAAMALDHEFAVYVWANNNPANHLDLLNEALEIISKESGKHHPDYAYILGSRSQLEQKQGDLPAAEATLRSILSTYEQFGLKKLAVEELSSFLGFQRSLAEIVSLQNRQDEAAKLIENTIEVADEFDNKFAKLLAKTLNQAGLEYERMGLLQPSGEAYEQALEKYEQLSGDESMEVAAVLYNLGYNRKDNGLHEEAKKLFQRSLDIRLKHHEPDDESVIIAKNQIAEQERLLGNHETAIAIQQEILKTRTDKLGATHRKTGTTHNNIALSYDALGDFTKSREHYLKFLAIREKQRDSKPLFYAHALQNVGWFFKEQNEFEKAEKLLLDSLLVRQQHMPQYHQEIATLNNFIGSLYLAMGNYPEAEKYYSDGLELHKVVAPGGSPRHAENLHNLAHLKRLQGKLSEAESYMQDSIDMLNLMIDNGASSLASRLSDRYNVLSLIHSDGGDLETAATVLEKAIEIGEQYHGPEHHKVATYLSNLGDLYRRTGAYEKSEEIHFRSLAIREKVWPEFHSETAYSLNHLGVLYHEMGEYEKARDYHEKALEMRLVVHPNGSPSVSTSYNNLGAAYQLMGDYERAALYYYEDYKLERKLLRPDHPSLTTSLNNIAVLYQNTAKYPLAEKYYREALDIYESNNLKDDGTIQTLLNLSRVLLLQDRPAESEEVLLEANAIATDILPISHSDHYKIQRNLAESESKLQRTEAAMERYRSTLQLIKKHHPHKKRLFGYVLSDIQRLAANHQSENERIETYKYIIEQEKQHHNGPFDLRYYQEILLEEYVDQKIDTEIVQHTNTLLDMLEDWESNTYIRVGISLLDKLIERDDLLSDKQITRLKFLRTEMYPPIKRNSPDTTLEEGEQDT